jgi:hypothetical protein
MAFPWDVIGKANIADDNIVEDLKLGLALAQVRESARILPHGVVVNSEFSASVSRTTWPRTKFAAYYGADATATIANTGWGWPHESSDHRAPGLHRPGDGTL